MKRSGAARDGSAALKAAVDRGGQLSGGALVQASIRARLLGIPLLRLDATVALAPAAFRVSSSALAGGNGLAEAVRNLNEGAEVLDRVRSATVIDLE